MSFWGPCTCPYLKAPDYFLPQAFLIRIYFCFKALKFEIGFLSARHADSQVPECVSTTGPRRPSEGRWPVPAVCPTSRLSGGGSATDSGKAPSPCRTRRRIKASKTFVHLFSWIHIWYFTINVKPKSHKFWWSWLVQNLVHLSLFIRCLNVEKCLWSWE